MGEGFLCELPYPFDDSPFSWGKNCHPVFKEGSIQPSYGELFLWNGMLIVFFLWQSKRGESYRNGISNVCTVR